jgi:hypothetical protein
MSVADSFSSTHYGPGLVVEIRVVLLGIYVYYASALRVLDESEHHEDALPI